MILPLDQAGVGQAGVEPATASRDISPALLPLSYWPVGTPGVEPGSYRFIRTASSPAESVPCGRMEGESNSQGGFRRSSVFGTAAVTCRLAHPRAECGAFEAHA